VCADARDSLCGAPSLDALPEGATVGTSSLRRRAQLLALRPDLRVEDLRGNVDTRLRKLAEGRYDAMVLAAAGLDRLGRSGEGSPLAPDVFVPASGQGCLALEARAGDELMVELGAALTDQDSLIRLLAERALVTALDATCHTPVAAHACLDGDELVLDAFVGLPDGSTWIRDTLTGDASDPSGLGAEVAARLLAAGAGDVLEEAESVIL
jgi:hydroxymethylbilane synthase